MFDERDNSIVITGTTESSDYMVTGYHSCLDEGDMWVVKINQQGNLLLGENARQRTGGNWYRRICATGSRYYAVYGSTQGYACYDSTIGDIGFGDCWLFILDVNGDTIANKIFGSVGTEAPASIVPLSDGFAATGYNSLDSFIGCPNYGTFANGDNAFIAYIDYPPLSVRTTINTSNLAIKAYPNPSRDNVAIILPNEKPSNVAVINNLGQTVYKQDVDGLSNPGMLVPVVGQVVYTTSSGGA